MSDTRRPLHPPFRAEHIGSLLRPQNLLDARRRHAAGEIDVGELRACEDDAIRGSTVQIDRS
jgi:methionine synthase II (cobalamin-independent)